ncbi:hypothetical protein [Dysgonomonas sp. 216]|nr:hypothetical protein [Dysgonomonas sp. 216]
MSQERKGNNKSEKKAPLKNLKEKRADKANKRAEKNKKGDTLK